MRYLSWKCVLGISFVAFIAGGILVIFDHYENKYLDSTYSSSQIAGAGDSSFQIVPYDPSDYSTAPSTIDGFMTFSDYYWGFELDYPEDWTFEPAMSGTFFSSPYENDEDTLIENASIAVENLSQYPEITLQDYAVASLNYLNGDPAYSFVDQGESSFGQYEGWTLFGKYRLGSQEAGVRSVFTIQGNAAYIFTYMYEIPEKEQYQSLIRSMMDRFILIPGEVESEEKNIPENSNQGAYGFTSLFHLKHF